MSLNPNALTDYATTKARLRLGNDNDQPLIEQLINEASAALERFTYRSLSYAPVVTEVLPLKGGPYLLLSRTPVVSIASITLDTLGLLPATEYAIDDSAAGIIYRDVNWPWSAQLRPDLNFQRDQQPGTEKKNTTVVYAGGYVTGPQASAQLLRTLPSDLERACLLTVVSYYREATRDPNIKQETVGKASRTYAGGDLPEQAKELALRYARWG
jgi:hypothetical protein